MQNVKIVKATPDYIVTEYEVHNGRTKQSKHKRSICIGGDFHGLMKANIELSQHGYHPYNAAYGRIKPMPNTIWLHESMIR